jgi:hypothetical protein
VKWLALITVLAACGSGPSGTPDAGCHVTYSGNYAASVAAATCASLSTEADGGPGTVLEVSLSPASNDGVRLEVQIDLGEDPQAGDSSSETTASWSAIGIAAQNNCSFNAGSASVPQGNFTLTLTSITASEAHGSLQLEQYVHAPPTVDCGPGDTESINVTF